MAKKGAASGHSMAEYAGYLGPTFSDGHTDVLSDNWTGEALNLQGPVPGPHSGIVAPDNGNVPGDLLK